MHQKKLSDPKISKGSAIFSACERYRYVLWRRWDDSLPYAQFIGLNPSTADAEKDDPTIRRCIAFAKSWGYGALCMTNIFAWRDTDPRGMKRVPDPIGPDNDKWLAEVAAEAGIVIAAWGTHGTHMYRGLKVKQMLPELHCLQKTEAGHPSHPLYLPATLTPIKL